jgi:purine nucleoside phosphorylase
MAGAKAEKAKRANTQAEIGIIGGSGLYSMNGLTKTREVHVKTPFGGAVGCDCARAAGGQARGVSRARHGDTGSCRARSTFVRMFMR